MISNRIEGVVCRCEDCCCDGDPDLSRARRDAAVVFEQVGLSLRATAERLDRNDCRAVKRRLRQVDSAAHGNDACRIRKALANLKQSVFEAVHHMAL